MNTLVKLGVGVLLLSVVFPAPALAGRYVLNQTPQTIQRYFGRPIATVAGGRFNETTYRYSIAGLRRVLPTLPKRATFQIGFINDRVHSIWLDANADEDKSFSYGPAEASQFFNYIFGYRPPGWQRVELPNGGGGHEGFLEQKACLGDGAATTFISYRLGEENIRLFYDPICEAKPANRR